jgi:hypothetical protein
MDIFQREARGMYSPPNGNDPQILPDMWKSSPDDETTIDLAELTDEELNALGWKGPIQMPPLPGTSYFTHDYQWNKQTREYDATEAPEHDRKNRVQYQQFWERLLNTTAYLTIKTASTQSLQANTLATEFIVLMSDARKGQINESKIQEILFEILENIEFTTEELEEIKEAFTESGMFIVYTLEPPTT